MLAIKDLSGEVYPLTGASNIKKVRRVNGEKELSLTLDKTRQNAHFFDDIEKLWRVIDFNGEEYPVLLYRDIAEGEGYVREFSCLHSFFDDMRNHVVYEQFSGSRTFVDMMNFIFSGSGYTFKIVDLFYAQEFENFGDDYGLELFKTALDRYKAEFTVDGKTVTLRAKIGDTTDFQYRHKFNLESIEREVDALDFSTYGEGYGKNGLKEVYESPLMAVYGKRPIKAIRDERYTQSTSLLKRLEEAVDSTLKIALTVKLTDLRASGYNKNHPNEGDTIILVDDRFGLKVDTRIVEITEILHPNGTVLDCDVMLSNFSNIFEQQRRIHNATKTLADAIEGKRPLPFEALAYATQQATIALQNAQTEIQFPENGGLLAVDKTNPNNMVVYNSAGIGISSDAGQTFKTAMTGAGIVADVVTAGTLRGILVEGVEIRGSLIESRESVNGYENYIQMTNNQLRSHGRYSRTWAGYSEEAVVNLGIRRGQMWISNEDSGYNLYFTEKGLSTTMSGAISSTTSGTLEFHSQRFNEESRGVTLHSSYGTAALVSDYSTVVSRAGLTNNIESRQYSVYVRPYLETRGGVNEFQFYVKDNPTASETDGALLYGNLTAGATHGSGIRFSKQANNPTVYATNNLGDIGTGDFHGKAFYGLDFVGSLKAPETNLYAMTAYDGEFRVTDKNGYNNGSMNFRPVIALDFRPQSTERIKTNIFEWEDSVLDPIIDSLKLYGYHMKQEVGTAEERVRHGVIIEREVMPNMVVGSSVDLYEYASWAMKGLQEAGIRIRALEDKMKILESV